MTTPLELAANAFTALAIVLAGRNNVHTWWTGIVGCTLFGLLFADSHLYADVVLQAVFVVTGALGWWKWLRGDHGEPLPITHASASNLLWTVPLGLAATAAYGALLHAWTQAYAPFLDSAVLVFSIIGQVLMMQRRVESWAFWLLVNTIAVPLYFSRGLVLTAVLYAGFWINAIVSWLHWRRLAQRHAQAAAAQADGLATSS
ncbi:nicotinamide riboside transporter PnuC [uncultured Massilia sp.]|uniref:nicotinamide riboside transporter PnuC n=1 Tax=uncultured Massilia sp. TaxID=169973 RepID=UPI0025FB8C1A|nr:nicotinamide riboside transporter PnuC [uncultured Massilia sp.]